MATIRITGDQVEIDNIATESTQRSIAEKLGAFSVGATNISDGLNRTSESAGIFQQALDVAQGATVGAAKSLAGFGVAAFDGTARVSTATDLLRRNFGSAGQAVMGLPDAILKAGEGYLDTFRQLSQSGAAFDGDILELKNSAAQTRMSLDAFAGVVAANSVDFAALGGNVTQGARAFTAFSKAFFDSSNDYAERLGIMGLTTEQINEQLARQMGIQNRANLMDERQRNLVLESTMRLTSEMDAMAKLTGKQKEQIQAEIDASMRKGQVEAKFRMIEMTQGKEAAIAARAQYQEAFQVASMAGPDAVAALEETFALGQVTSDQARRGLVALGPAADDVQSTFRAIADTPLSNNIDTMINNMGGAIVERVNSYDFAQMSTLAAANQYGQAGATMMESAGEFATAIQRYQEDGMTYSEAMRAALADARAEAEGTDTAGSQLGQTMILAEQRIQDLGAVISDKLLGPDGAMTAFETELKEFATYLRTQTGRTNIEDAFDGITDQVINMLNGGGASAPSEGSTQAMETFNSELQRMYEQGDEATRNKIEGLLAALTAMQTTDGDFFNKFNQMLTNNQTTLEEVATNFQGIDTFVQNMVGADVYSGPDSAAEVADLAQTLQQRFNRQGGIPSIDPSETGYGTLSGDLTIDGNLIINGNANVTPAQTGTGSMFPGGILPNDMLMMLHKGERVLNAAETQAFNAMENGANNMIEQAAAMGSGMSNSSGTLAEKLDNLNQSMLQLVNINMQAQEIARRQLKGIRGMSGDVMTGFGV